MKYKISYGKFFPVPEEGNAVPQNTKWRSKMSDDTVVFTYYRNTSYTTEYLSNDERGMRGDTFFSEEKLAVFTVPVQEQDLTLAEIVASKEARGIEHVKILGYDTVFDVPFKCFWSVHPERTPYHYSIKFPIKMLSAYHPEFGDLQPYDRGTLMIDVDLNADGVYVCHGGKYLEAEIQKRLKAKREQVRPIKVGNDTYQAPVFLQSESRFHLG